MLFELFDQLGTFFFVVFVFLHCVFILVDNLFEFGIELEDVGFEGDQLMDAYILHICNCLFVTQQHLHPILELQNPLFQLIPIPIPQSNLLTLQHYQPTPKHPILLLQFLDSPLSILQFPGILGFPYMFSFMNFLKFFQPHNLRFEFNYLNFQVGFLSFCLFFLELVFLLELGDVQAHWLHLGPDFSKSLDQLFLVVVVAVVLTLVLGSALDFDW